MFKARIVIADSDDSHRKSLKSFLDRAGYAVIYEAKDGLKALKAIQELTPDLAIIDTDLKIYSGFYVAKTLAETLQAPVILISNSTSQEYIRDAAEVLAFSYLIKPVGEGNLLASIEVVLSNYQRFVAFKKEIKELQKEIKGRKLIEKAKGLLMKHQDISEDEAYNKIRRESMNKHTSMARIASSLISYYEFMDR